MQIAIDSESPPRSALGGSSVAAVALAAALSEGRCRQSPRAVIGARSIGLLAHAVEESVADVEAPSAMMSDFVLVRERWVRRSLSVFEKTKQLAWTSSPQES